MSDQHVVFELKLKFKCCFVHFLGISLTENCKMEFCLPFICKHKETLVKTIRCNLTKTGRIFATFTESLYKSMGKRPLNFQ